MDAIQGFVCLHCRRTGRRRRDCPDSSLNKARKTGRHGWIYTAITAAAAILIAVVMIALPRQNDNYAVIDGKVYTNKKVVEEEALKALEMVSSDEEDNFGALELMRQ